MTGDRINVRALLEAVQDALTVPQPDTTSPADHQAWQSAVHRRTLMVRGAIRHALREGVGTQLVDTLHAIAGQGVDYPTDQLEGGE